MSRRKAEVVTVTPVGDNHQVLTVEGGSGAYRKEPCPGCPWRTDQDGVFPAEAFRHSAKTAHDMALPTFACHEAGVEHGAICAGFLLRGGDHNLTVRMKQSNGKIDLSKVRDGGHDLHPGYISMAIANGVAPDDPALKPCRLSYREQE